MANIFKKLFKTKKSQPRQLERAEILSGGPAYFSPFSGNAYENDIYRAAVDAIARNVAKLKGAHVVTMPGQQRKDGDASLNRILQVRPNPYMTAYDVIYKLTTHYFLHNNSFAYLQKDERGNLSGIWPLRPQAMEFVADLTGQLYCKFLFANGQDYILPYNDIFHIRRHFNSNDLLGDSNAAIIPILDLAHTQSEGLAAAIKSSATIRGLLKFNQVLSPEKLKQEKEAFINDYLTVTNSGGIAVLDSKADYTPLKNEPYLIDDKQLQAIKQKIYEYLGVSEKIVNSSYNEDEWNSFYESTVEPLALQFSLELTSKVFTERERSFGNQIIFTANRLQYASGKTKIELLRHIAPLGMITINEGREILNLPAVEGGDRRLQSLNFVGADKADEYQLGGNADEGNSNSGD